MIDMKKRCRLRDGRPVRILAVDIGGMYPVVGVHPSSTNSDDSTVSRFTAEGCYYSSPGYSMDLIEISTYEDFKKGEPVITDIGGRRYFSHVDKRGRPHCFVDGSTEWSSGGRTALQHTVRRPTEEELK